MPRTKKSVEDVPVAVTEEVVTDIEDSPVKEVVYTFQILGYVFLVGAVAAAVAWFIYVARWQKHHSDNIADDDGNSISEAEFYKATVRSQEYTICFQALVASVLLYFAFRHHYRHH